MESSKTDRKQEHYATFSMRLSKTFFKNKRVLRVETWHTFQLVLIIGKFLSSFKINQLIHLPKHEFFFFYNSIPANVSVFQLYNRFVFQRTRAVDRQSILKFLQFIHNFQASDYNIRSPVYVISAVSLKAGPPWPVTVSAL